MPESSCLSWPQLFKRAATKPFDYRSTSSRAEYWVFVISMAVVQAIVSMIVTIGTAFYVYASTAPESMGSESSGLISVGVLLSVVSVLNFLISIYIILATSALANRRLRDLQMNTWLTPLFLIPCLNFILALVYFTRKRALA